MTCRDCGKPVSWQSTHWYDNEGSPECSPGRCHRVDQSQPKSLTVSPTSVRVHPSAVKELREAIMALREPPEDDPLAQLEAEMGDVETPVVVDVTALDTTSLLNLYHDLTTELTDRRELLSQHTDEGRELHSRRGAVRIELSQRGLL